MSDTTTNTTITTTTPNVKEGANASISVRVTTQAGEETIFKLKPHTPLGKLMDAFCTRLGAQRSSVKFLFDGTRIQSEQTPAQLGMSDNEQIDAVLEQVGGGGDKNDSNKLDWLKINVEFIVR